MAEKLQVPDNEEVNKELEHYKERAFDLAKRGLIKNDDKKSVMAEKDPDRAKSTLLAALEKKHKETRESYMDNGSDERQDEVGPGLA